MRTEAANCGGGSVIMSKSRQDVEAAFAIAQLSEQEPRGTDCEVRTNGCASAITGSSPRFSHVRTAVMPHTSSRVEKAAVKRKFDWLDAGRATVNKQARLHDAVAEPDPVQRAIASERGPFITARRHQQLASSDTAGDNELLGRFIRTCGPSGGDNMALYVKVDDNTAKPTLVSAVPGLYTTSRQTSERGMNVEDVRRSLLSASVTDGSHPRPTEHQTHEPHHRHSGMLRHNDARSMPLSKYYRLADNHERVPVVLRSYEGSLEKKLQGRGTWKSSECEDHVDRRRERSSSLVSAYYNLGQSAAAAAASQLLLVKPLRSSTSASVRPARRCVDSGTLRKVRRGEFGALSTLRLYCSQLRRHSEPTSNSSDAVKESADDEVAMDLSVRKHTKQSVVSDGWYRSTRSCGCSPSVRLDEVAEPLQPAASGPRQQLMSSLSLPSSPYTSRHDDLQVSLSQRHQDNDVTETTHSNDVSDGVPDSQLPLKKRRLYHHQQPQQSTLSVISEGDCDKQRSSDECSDNIKHESSPTSFSADCEVTSERNVDRLSCSQSVFLHADEDGDLPLHIAVAKGTVAAVDSIISIMLSLGVSLDYRNNLHQTALHLAVLTDQPDVVHRLLNCGASSNVVDRRGQTCLHTAVLLGSTSCLRLLLRQSQDHVNINAVSYDGVTALHLAVQRGNIAAVRCLLSAGADVDVIDSKYGHTALFYALQRNDVTAVELLLSYGASRTGAPSVVVQPNYISKCSTDVLQLHQPAINHRHLPTCCPTG